MNIGIDLDGIIIDLESYQVKKGKRYFKKKLKNQTLNMDEYDVQNVFNVTHKERMKFWAKFIYDYCMHEPLRPGTAEFFRKLGEEGYNRRIITGRVFSTRNDLLGKIFRQMVYTRLKREGIEYESIDFCSEEFAPEEKLLACKKHQIDVMIEDRADNIDTISKHIPVIVFNAGYNKECQGENLFRVNNMKEAKLAVEKVKALKEEKLASFPAPKYIVDGKFKRLRTADENKLSPTELIEYYKAMKANLLSLPFDKKTVAKQNKYFNSAFKIIIPSFNKIYKSQAINKEVIPFQSGVIYVSNHLGYLDQFPILDKIGQKPIHFMIASTLVDAEQGKVCKAILNALEETKKEKVTKEKSSIGNLIPTGTTLNLATQGLTKTTNGSVLTNESNIQSTNLSKRDVMKKVTKAATKAFVYKLRSMVYQKSGSIVVDRDSIKSKVQSIEEAAKIVAHGGNVFVFPEGTRKNPEKFMKEFLTGPATIAKMTGAPIVPFAINDNYKFRSDDLIVRAGKPMTVEPTDDVNEKTLELRDQIATMIWENMELEKTTENVKTIKR